MSDRIRPLDCGPLANQPHRAIRFVNPEDGGWLGTTHVEPLDMIIRPSTGMTAHASLFVGRRLVHVPREDAPAIASVLCNAAGCKRAEVLEALGAVDKVEAECDAKIAADSVLHWKARAEKAEANYREVKQDNRDLVEQSHQNTRRAADELRAKIAEAEAIIDRWLDDLSKPRTITSADELWGLPVLSVISDCHGHVYQKFESDDNDAWLAGGELDAWIAEDILNNFSPVTVLHIGGTDA